MSGPAHRVTVVAHEVHRAGGMERAQAEMITGLLGRGWSVTVIASVCTLPAHHALRVVRVPVPRRPFSVAFPAFALVAGLLAARHRQGPLVCLGAIIPNRADAITVQFCHASFRRQGVARGVRRTAPRRINDALVSEMASALERWCYRPGRVRRLLAVSRAVAVELHEHFDSSIASEVLPNGVDLDRFARDPARGAKLRGELEIPGNSLVVAFVGGDWERKGLGILIEAAGAAGWTVLVAGKGDAASYGARAAAAGVPIRFLGQVDDPGGALSAADAFALPSAYEGFALVTLEAAACSVPLVVTEATGAGSLVDAGAGLLTERSPRAVAAALGQLADPDARRRAGSAGRVAVAAYTWPALVDRYEQVMLELAG